VVVLVAGSPVVDVVDEVEVVDDVVVVVGLQGHSVVVVEVDVVDGFGVVDVVVVVSQVLLT